MINYSQNKQPELREMIEVGLHRELEKMKGRPHPLNLENFYAHEGIDLVGGVLFERHENGVWIDSLWVNKDYRRQSIGRRLLQHVMAFAVDHNCEKIQLTTYFESSLPFYQNQGFVILSSLPHWKYDVECYFLEKIIELASFSESS